LTPRYQQTFKWYAGRSEVFCWKDIPQDAQAVVEWERRRRSIFGREVPLRDEGTQWQRIDALGHIELESLLELAAKYDFQYLVVDRTRFDATKSHPIVVPVYINDSFSVYHLRPSPTGSGPDVGRAAEDSS
jgi:hypothetical protein